VAIKTFSMNCNSTVYDLIVYVYPNLSQVCSFELFSNKMWQQSDHVWMDYDSIPMIRTDSYWE